MQESGEFIISFGEQPLGGPSQGWNRIFPLMAARHKILHVNQHFYLRSGGPSLEERRHQSGLRKLSENLYEYQPPWYLPRNYRYPWWNRLIDMAGAALIRKTARKLGCRRPILYFWHPRYVPMIGKLGEKLVCYHICDDYFDPRWNEPPELRIYDRKLLTEADLVFGMSPPLVREALEFRSKVSLIPNGVDFARFEEASMRGGPGPADIESIPRPRIGYTGNINAKLDFELLAHIAEQRPNWSIVLVGAIKATEQEIGRCRHLPNVYFLGSKRYEEICEYVAALDVCVISNVLQGWVLSTYPLKLHEYLAAGKPVVSVDIEAVREFSSVVRIAGTPEDWLRSIEESLKPERLEKTALRRQIARANSWEQRVFDIEEQISQALEARQSVRFKPGGPSSRAYRISRR